MKSVPAYCCHTLTMPVHHRITPDLLQTNETSASRMKLMDADSGNRPSSGSACTSYGILYDNNRQNKCHRQSFQPDNPCHLLQINPRIPLRAKRSRFWRHASSRISICLTHRACMQTAHLPHPCKYRVGDPFTHRKAFSAAASPALPSITASLSVWTNAKTFHCVKAPTAKSTLPQKCSFPIIPYIQSSRSRF